jgi:succinate dehydrogenase / fumarate reductase iron-sulfur subunit
MYEMYNGYVHCDNKLNLKLKLVSTHNTPGGCMSIDLSSCIGCGACVAACKYASAMLFTSAKVSQLALLPQGQIEAATRAQAMVAQMDEEGFGACSNTGACEAECPKGISVSNISRLNR